MPELPENVQAAHSNELLPAEYNVCINQSGQINEVTPRHGIAGADPPIMAALRSYRVSNYRLRILPPSVGGVDPPELPPTLCLPIKLRFAVPGKSTLRLATNSQLRAQRIAGQMPTLPNEAKAAFAGQTLVAKYRVCVDPNSRLVRSVDVLPSGSLAYWDQVVVDTLRTWSWDLEIPPGQEPCFLEEFKFVFEAGPPQPLSPYVARVPHGDDLFLVLQPWVRSQPSQTPASK